MFRVSLTTWKGNVAALVLASATLAACTPGGETREVASSRPEPEVGRLVNQARAAQGLAQLTTSPALTDAAVSQARHMASLGQLTHRSPEGRTVKDRIEARGFDACLAAENTAAYQPDAAAVTAGWLASPGHRSNIMIPQATHVGAGSALTADGARFWVLALARPC